MAPSHSHHVLGADDDRKKNTWERDGATLSMRQLIGGALIMTVILIGILILLVKFAVSRL